MSRAVKLLWQGTRYCGSCILAFAVWTLWLVLLVVLAAQIYIATHNELELPGFVLRALEERLAASGVRVTFGRTAFDPTGRVLIEDARISLPAFAEPVITARAIYTQIDPWALAVGKFEPRAVTVSGASVAIPAMLSRSGTADVILRDLDTTFVPGDNTFSINHLSGRVAGVAVSARGSIFLPSPGTGGAAALPGVDFLAKQFAAVCRELEAARVQLAAFEQPALDLVLSPSESRVAIAEVTLFARRWKMATPLPVEVAGLQIVTKFPLLGEAPVAARLDFAADDLVLPFGTTAHGVHAFIRGTLRPTQISFIPLALEFSAESLAAPDFSATTLTAHLTPGPLPQLSADVVARVLGAPLAVQAIADFKAETATVHFDGALSPRVMDSISARVHTDARRFFNFTELEATNGLATMGPGWKFEKVSMRAAVRGIDAYHVHMDEGRAVVEFDGRHFRSPEAWGRIGENSARGTYDHDLTTRDFRFLLAGRLRPLAISGWFGSWWSNFFDDFELPVAPPEASVDIQGRWGESEYSNNFVFFETTGPVIRGTKLDFVRGRLFIRPGFFDGLEIFTTSGPGAARGTFNYTLDPATHAWRRLRLDLVSTVDPLVAAHLIGPAADDVFAPFAFAQTPALKVSGYFDGPGAPGGAHVSLDLEGRSAGEFRLQGFPLENIAFTAAVRDDDITVDNLRAGFANGVATGRVRLAGRGPERRVTASLALKDGSLGRATEVVQNYAAFLHGTPAPPPGKFVQEKANVRLDLSAAVEGKYSDPFSYRGDGTATLQGAGLGEVPLLGQLSDLLKFTALRFTSATAKYKIQGTKVAFSEFNLRGANSAIESHGDYALDRRELDFKVKILPFQESGNVIKTAIGVVLSPLSNVFEVLLTGSLEKPKWAFAIGPTNFLRSLAPTDSTEPKPGVPPSTEASGAPASAPATPKPTG